MIEDTLHAAPTDPTLAELEAMAGFLEASGRYRVLRQLQSRSIINAYDGSPVRIGLYVDVETTGLDPEKDEIIELAMVPFSYSLDGRIFEVLPPFDRLREPSVPISAATTAITGIDASMVIGQTIDPAEVAAFAAPASLVIAHKAAFDRAFAEAFCDEFKTKPWACSMSQIDWVGEGFEGTKLAYLASCCGFFYDKHRAVHDCMAGIEILARPLPRSGTPAMSRMLEAARETNFRIWAENSPYDRKDLLKARGYKWLSQRKIWYVDVKAPEYDDEIAFLQKEVYGRPVELPTTRITAYERFSDRC